ncbi:DUF7344 domain-containing protein [Halorussus salinus]|uniref:DUF7344 domain-containing protein n=1 Tax=Halorussus salinus TaxID=1364935 RepID=UPI001092CF2E|nr:hypothetical protein [Halorussus salinus]
MVSDRTRRDSETDDSRTRERLVAAAARNRRRRYALYYLHQRSGPVAVAALARQVAAWERTATPDEVASELAERVASSLRERHLPALADSGLVAYDADADRVVGTVSDPTAEVLLANHPRTRLPWYKVYLLVTVLSAGLLGLVRLDVPPFDAVEPIAAAALVVALFAVASLGHWYDVYRWRRATEEMPPDFAVTLDEEVRYRESLDDLDESDGESGIESERDADGEPADEGSADDRGG